MDGLKEELDGLMRYIQRVREEIAAIDRSADGDDHFESMGEQLEAVVAATSAATNSIMAAMESNEKLLDVLREKITDPEQIALLDQITSNGNDVFEACSFQDITGQRVNKVVKSVTYVEARVSALVDIWGKDQIAMIEVTGDQEQSADEKLLNGPQLEGQGLSQDDIDKLFD
ncbi:MAG: protein phosphatase CheZ [Alphaproteobacteria bacterium]|nr:protein phosphatase CheZ [Alphaproteobacteria bacterium]